jgi:hypothetical protein
MSKLGYYRPIDGTVEINGVEKQLFMFGEQPYLYVHTHSGPYHHAHLQYGGSVYGIRGARWDNLKLPVGLRRSTRWDNIKRSHLERRHITVVDIALETAKRLGVKC